VLYAPAAGEKMTGEKKSDVSARKLSIIIHNGWQRPKFSESKSTTLMYNGTRSTPALQWLLYYQRVPGPETAASTMQEKVNPRSSGCQAHRAGRGEDQEGHNRPK
jgi:hypothetical protein